MSGYIFSVSADSVTFYQSPSQLLSELQGGYQQAAAGLFNAGQVDAWGVEMLIYRVEEILESQGGKLPGPGEARSNDALLQQVSQRWLAGSSDITPQALESAFNQLTDRLSYGPLQLSAGDITAFCYLVFLREMTHHLRISHIRYQS